MSKHLLGWNSLRRFIPLFVLVGGGLTWAALSDNFPHQWFSGNSQLATTYKDVRVDAVVWGTVGNGPGQVISLPYTEGELPPAEQLRQFAITCEGTFVYPAGTPKPERQDLMLYSIGCNGELLDAVSVNIEQVGEPMDGPEPGTKKVAARLGTPVVAVRSKRWGQQAGEIKLIYLPTGTDQSKGAKLTFIEPTH